jgi:hypothetical protein
MMVSSEELRLELIGYHSMYGLDRQAQLHQGYDISSRVAYFLIDLHFNLPSRSIYIH